LHIINYQPKQLFTMPAAQTSTTTKRKYKSGGKYDRSKKAKLTTDKDNNNNKKKDNHALSKSAEKRQVRKERQSHRRHAETVEEAKLLWNKLRVKTNTPQDTQDLMEKVMTLIRGKVREIALQHDASRVVQAAIQFGSNDQRKELLTEILSEENSLVELAKCQYAHFVCLKLIKYCADDEQCLKLIVKSLQGEIPKLAVHGVAVRVVESLFLNLPPKVTAPLKQEFYGPHFSLFVKELSGVPTLQSNLETAKTDTQREAALDFVKNIINKGMTKNFYAYDFFQQILAEYVDVADPSDIRTMASSVVDHSVFLLSSRAGTRVVAACASYGTPKDRKRICKSLKGYTKSSLLHKDAYLALLRLIQVTDDTVSIHKSVLNEILSEPKANKEEGEESSDAMLELALSGTGSKLFLMLLAKDQSSRMKYFDPYERSILEPVPMIKENGKEVPTSKKDDETRRKELLKHLDDALVDLCIQHAKEMVFSPPGSRGLKEVYSSFPSEKLANAIVDVCESSLDPQRNDQSQEKTLSLFEDPTGHLSIKNLILYDAESESSFFSDALVNRLGKQILDIAQSNRGAFVAASLFKVPSVKASVQKIFRTSKKEIEAKSKSKGSGPTAGYAALLKEIS